MSVWRLKPPETVCQPLEELHSGSLYQELPIFLHPGPALYHITFASMSVANEECAACLGCTVQLVLSLSWPSLDIAIWKKCWAMQYMMCWTRTSCHIHHMMCREICRTAKTLRHRNLQTMMHAWRAQLMHPCCVEMPVRTNCPYQAKCRHNVMAAVLTPLHKVI